MKALPSSAHPVLRSPSLRPAAALLLPFVAGIVLPIAATAQGAVQPAGGPAPAAPACKPDVRGLGDSLTYMVGARARAFDPAQGVPQEHVDLVASAIRQQLAVPKPLGVDVYSVGYVVRGAGDTLWVAHADVSGLFGLTTDRAGHLLHAERFSSTLSPALDSAVVGAIERAGGAGAFPAVPDSATGDTIPMRIALVTYDERRPVPSMPFFRIRVPVVRNVTPLHPLPGNQLGELPDMTQLPGRAGVVEIQAVIGPDGRVVLPAVWVENASSMEWLHSIALAIGDFRYEPARVKGCPIAARDRQTFRITSK